MASLTPKGIDRLIKLEKWQRNFDPHVKRFTTSVNNRLTQYHLLEQIEENPIFVVEQHSMFRPDWNTLKAKGYIIDSTREPIYVIEGNERLLHRKLR